MMETQVDGAPAEAPPQAATPVNVAATRLAKRAAAPWIRRIGNLLIVVGVLLMVGVGSYLAWQTYTNTQEEQQIADQHQAAGDLNLLPPTAAPESGAPVAAGTTPSASHTNVPAPVAVPADQTVRVNAAPLPSLNTLKVGMSLVAQAPSKQPIKVAIPSVGIDSGVVPIGWEMLPGKDGQQSSQWKVAEYAAGHHAGSANPGQVGNVVISGHVDWKGEVFKNLHEVKRGDEVHIYTEDREFLYIVQDTVLVKEDGASDEQKRQNARYMDPTPDQTLTLITCFPYGIDDHRLIVIAKPYDSNLAARPDLMIK